MRADGDDEPGGDGESSKNLLKLLLALGGAGVVGLGVLGLLIYATNPPPNPAGGNPTPPAAPEGVRLDLVKSAFRDFKLSGQRRLAVSLKITNTSPAKRITWNLRQSAVSLRDEHGNQYACDGGVPEATVDPGKEANVQVSFPRPVDQAERFTLSVGGENIGTDRAYTFTFERKDITPAP